MNITVDELVQVTGGSLLCGDGATVVRSVALDSRRMDGGDLFVPVIGEKTDGHRFIESAFTNGAAAAFTSEHDEYQSKQPLIRVDDTVAALQRLGTHLRRGLKMPFVGITGSVGKTSTREMVTAALSGGLRVTETAGNSNGQLGVPVTLGRLDETADIAVLEMGMSMPGEMERIAAIVRPDIAIMTNIGVTHIENLGSRERILEEKLHIADGFGADNTLIINGDNDLLSTLKGRMSCRLITYGFGENNDFRARDMRTENGAAIYELVRRDSGESCTVRLSVPGEHNVMNSLAALAVSYAVGVDQAAAVEAVAGYHGFDRRLQFVKGCGFDMIDDSYNASPESARAAIGVLRDTAEGRRCVMIFADMLELGENAPRFHEDICRFASENGVSLLITIGPLARTGAQRYLSGGEGNGMELVSFDDNDAAKEALGGLLRQGDHVLVKGSNGMHLERIVNYLEELRLEIR